jgi:hypothetical protein
MSHIVRRRESLVLYKLFSSLWAQVTIAEVEEIVEIGEIPPDHVHVPSIYVQRVVKGISLFFIMLKRASNEIAFCFFRIPLLFLLLMTKLGTVLNGFDILAMFWIIPELLYEECEDFVGRSSYKVG